MHLFLKNYKINDFRTAFENEARSYDHCKIKVECPNNTFAIFKTQGSIETKQYYEALGLDVENVFSRIWNFWDFRIESNDELYLNAHLEPVNSLINYYQLIYLKNCYFK